MTPVESLWGDEFNLPDEKEQIKKIKTKIAKPKKIEDISAEKKIKSKKVSDVDKLALIKETVGKELGRYKNTTSVLNTKVDLHSYIDKCIENGLVSIDTETNRCLTPWSAECQLMGICLHTPGEKAAYGPVSHINMETNELLSNQLKPGDIKLELQRLVDAKTKIVMHNAKFDYQVIKCACDIALPVYWDTLIMANLIDENEDHGLKALYKKYIDDTADKYNIETFFNSVPYAIVDPDTFALYAATDSYKTTALYNWQVEYLKQPGFESILRLFFEVEMPVSEVAAEMELRGCHLDVEYAGRLSKKYRAKMEVVDKELDVQLAAIKPLVDEWRLSSDGQSISGKKKKCDQVTDPITVTSPLQLSILFYDILRVGVVDKKTPRGTGVKILEKIYAKTKNPLCKLILDKRECDKLLNTFIEKLPQVINEKDKRLHGRFNTIGAGTGRIASSDPNLMNIPSHAKDVRMLFSASVFDRQVEYKNSIDLSIYDQVETKKGFKMVKDLISSDLILVEDDSTSPKTSTYCKCLANVKVDDHTYRITLE